LQRIAAAGGGQYFELDRDPDRDIANAIIDAGRAQAPATTKRARLKSCIGDSWRRRWCSPRSERYFFASVLSSGSS
jgi:hypothetical protein